MDKTTKPPRLMDRLRQELRARHYSRSTEQAYRMWVKRYIFFHKVRHPKEMAEPEVNAFLTHLAVKEDDSIVQRAVKSAVARAGLTKRATCHTFRHSGRDLFFQVISKRSETGSVILSTNKAFREWGEIFQDNAVATAIAERLIEHGELIKIEGSSYRVKKRRQKSLGLGGSGKKRKSGPLFRSAAIPMG